MLQASKLNLKHTTCWEQNHKVTIRQRASSFCVNKYIMKKEMSKKSINKSWYAKKYFKMAIMLLLEIFRRLLALFCCDPACTQKLFNHIIINHSNYDLYWIKLYFIRIKNLFLYCLLFMYLLERIGCRKSLNR